MAKDSLKTRLKKITFVEWLISSTGTVVFLLTLLFVLYNALFGNGSPPDIKLKIIWVQQNGADYLITIEVANKGDATVEGLEVEATLVDENNSEVEKGTTTFDYVPGRSGRKGGIFFRNNPDKYKIELRPLGFEEP
jgi:uncharacterized protein (TIGR02588 family)